MKILAFLQNPWFLVGTDPRLIKKYKTDMGFHRRVLYLSATGRALHRAFGPELYGRIIWENANPKHGSNRNARMPADIIHMARILMRHKPDLVLCFGDEAKRGMTKLIDKPWLKPLPNILYAPHPMARGSAAEHLRKIVGEVNNVVLSNTR